MYRKVSESCWSIFSRLSIFMSLLGMSFSLSSTESSDIQSKFIITYIIWILAIRAILLIWIPSTYMSITGPIHISTISGTRIYHPNNMIWLYIPITTRKYIHTRCRSLRIRQTRQRWCCLATRKGSRRSVSYRKNCRGRLKL